MYRVIENTNIPRSSIIDSLSGRISKKTPIGLAWFYCDGTQNTSDKTKTRYILGSIFRQLVETSRMPIQSQLELLKKLKEKASYTVQSKLAKLFVKSIVSITKCFTLVYIFVDGIDECPERTELCGLILELSSTNLKVLVSSRGERDIASVFHNEIQLEIAENFSLLDIEIHIDWTFKNDPKLKTMKSDLKKDIKTQLLSNSSGT